MSRRSTYTRADDVIVTRKDGTVERMRRYSPSELNAVISNKKPRKVAQIVAAKASKAKKAYLGLINADN